MQQILNITSANKSFSNRHIFTCNIHVLSDRSREGGSTNVLSHIASGLLFQVWQVWISYYKVLWRLKCKFFCVLFKQYMNSVEIKILWLYKMHFIVLFKQSVLGWYHNSPKREKGRDLTQSYDRSPYTNRKSKKQCDNTKTPPKTSITQWLQTDLGRSVRVTIVTQLVWLNWFMGSQPSH